MMDALLSLDRSVGIQYSDMVSALEAQKFYQLIGDCEQLARLWLLCLVAALVFLLREVGMVIGAGIRPGVMRQ